MVVMALLGLAMPAAVGAAQSVTAVQWYQDMHLGDARPSSLAEWRDVLTTPWRMNGTPVSFPVGDGRARVNVKSCAELFDVRKRALSPAGQDAAIYQGWALKCHAIRLLIDAARPKQDFLGDFSLDGNKVRALPAGMAFSISHDDERRVSDISRRKGLLGEYLKGATVEVIHSSAGRQVTIKDADGGIQRLTVLARGDFDHDGIGDVLVAASNEVVGGDYRASYLFIVSRRAADGPLELRRTVSLSSAKN
jgi:hypothetical protein